MTTPPPIPPKMNNLQQIELFPNTGHHYYFIELSSSFLSSDPKVKAECEAAASGWETFPDLQWVRYRRGNKPAADGTDRLGLWLAIETNLGTAQRGFIYVDEGKIAAKKLPAGYQDPAPYAFADDSHLHPVPLTFEGDPIAEITWKRPKVNTRTNVDLVVDFGNTRTVALLLHEDKDGKSFTQICHPLRLIQRGSEYEPFHSDATANDPCAIVDSWMILHEPLFADHEMPAGPNFKPLVSHKTGPRDATLMEMLKGERSPITQATHETQRIPHMFIDFSPSLIGGSGGAEGARNILTFLDLPKGPSSFLSSPKRFAWDDEERGTEGRPFWSMSLNILTHHAPDDNNLSCPVMLFMDTDGREWKIEDPPNERANPADRPSAKANPTFPRSDALTWVALSILERAYFQMNSQTYLAQLAAPDVPNRLRSVLVTFPSGWTREELDCYRSKWQKAINIFTLAHLKERCLATETTEDGAPVLRTDLDEAVSSQLPILYSEMQHLPDGESWIGLVGRGKGTEAKVRILNIDIGGGTTDVAVVDYRDEKEGVPVDLKATILFKNSSTIAGDALVKRIIETVLLPQLGRFFQASPPEMNQFKSLFGTPPAAWLAQWPAFHQEMSRIVLLVFIPIVNAWLAETAVDRYGNGSGQGLTPQEMRGSDGSPSVSKAIVDKLNQMAATFLVMSGAPLGFELLPFSDPLNYDQSKLKQCIQDEVLPLFKSLADLLTAFDCDLAILSGKPTELEQVYDLLKRELPLLPQRIIRVKDFPSGNWYPLGVGTGRIYDAKTVTVVGAALYQAMKNGLIGNGKWSLTCEHDLTLFSENFWGTCDLDNPMTLDNLLDPGQDRVGTTMMVGTRIGRKYFKSRFLPADPVYELACTGIIWWFFIGWDRGLIHLGGRRYRS